MRPDLLNKARILPPLVMVALLVGCSGSPEYPASSSRYTIDQDRAPTQGALDVASIPEVVPTPINRTSAGNRSPYTVLGKSYRVMPTEEGYEERGVASWYGEKFHGHQTSNGVRLQILLYSVLGARQAGVQGNHEHVNKSDDGREPF